MSRAETPRNNIVRGVAEAGNGFEKAGFIRTTRCCGSGNVRITG
jgi:hypothetical protein